MAGSWKTIVPTCKCLHKCRDCWWVKPGILHCLRSSCSLKAYKIATQDRTFDKAEEGRITGFALMKLPAELREDILKRCMELPIPVEPWMFQRYSENIAPTTMTCRQLRHETELLFYRSNTFRYTVLRTDSKTLVHRFLIEKSSHLVPRRVRPMIDT